MTKKFWIAAGWLFAVSALSVAGMGIATAPEEVKAAEEGPFAVEIENANYSRYGDFSSALGAAKEEGGVRTVYALSDEPILLHAPIAVSSGKVVLKSISYATGGIWAVGDAALLKNADDYQGALVSVTGGASLTLENLIFEGGKDALTLAGASSMTFSEVTTSEGTGVSVREGSDLFIGKGASLGGEVFLANGCVADLTDYQGGAVKFAVEDDRSDGAVAVRQRKNNRTMSEIVSLKLPETLSDDYFAGYPYRARYLRTCTREDGSEEYGFGGFGISASQKTGKLDLTLVSHDPLTAASITAGGETISLKEGEGGFTGTLTPGKVTEISPWSARLTVGSAEVETAIERPLGYISIDRNGGTFAAPAGTQYVTSAKERAPMSESGLLPDDLGISEDGVAVFVVDGAEREVLTGARAALPSSGFGGTQYDASNDRENASVQLVGEVGYEYALKDAKGNFLTNSLGNILWRSLSDSATAYIKFENLDMGAEYTVFVRTPAADGGLPSVMREAAKVFTLTPAQNSARTLFVDSHADFEEGGYALTEGLTTLQNFAALEEKVAALPRIAALAEELRRCLPDAFAGEWREKHEDVLSLEIDGSNLAEAKEKIGLASTDYEGLEAHIGELTGDMLTAAEKGAVLAGTQTLLKEDYAELLAQGRLSAELDLEEGLAYALTDFGINEDNASARETLYARKQDFLSRLPASSTWGEICGLVEEGRAVLLLDAYYESRTAKFSAYQEVKSAYSEEVGRVGSSSAGTRRETAFAGMLALYKVYALQSLQGILSGEEHAELCAGEKGRIEEVAFSSEKTHPALEELEKKIDAILAQAKEKGALESYYLELLAPQEGRLSAEGLPAEKVDKLEETLKAGMLAIEGADEDGRSEALTAAEISLYRALAMAVLDEAYAAYPEPSAELTAIHAEAKTALGAPHTQLAEAETALGGIAQTAVCSMELRAYYDELQGESALPEEEELAPLYEKIETATFAEKERAAYTGMLEIYKKVTLGHITAMTAASSAEGKEDFAAVGSETAEDVALGTGDLGEELELAEGKLAAAEEGVRQKLSVREYFEGLENKEAALGELLESIVGAHTGTIDTAPSAEEKLAAGYAGKGDLYRAYSLALLEGELGEKFAGTRLTELLAFVKEGVAPRIEEAAPAAPTEEALTAFEEEVDALHASGYWKAVLYDAFLTLAEGYDTVPAELTEALQKGYTAIDEAPMSEERPFDSEKEAAAYAEMLALAKTAFRLTGADLKKEFSPLTEDEEGYYNALSARGEKVVLGEGPHAEALEKAQKTLTDLAAELRAGMMLYKYRAKLVGVSDTALEEAFSEGLTAIGSAADKAAEEATLEGALLALYVQTYYTEYTAAHTVLSAAFTEIGAEDAQGIAAAKDAYEGISSVQTDKTICAAVLAYFDTQVPIYANSKPTAPYALFLTDLEKKAAFAREKAETAGKITAEYDYDADEALQGKLEALEEEALAELGNVVYLQYGTENTDPAAYGAALSAKLADVLAKFEGAREEAVAADMIEKFSEALGAELAGYTKSGLARIKKEDIERTYTVLLEELGASSAGGLAKVRAGLLTVRAAYVKAVAEGYAALFDLTAEALTGVTDEALRTALFGELLRIYRTHVTKTLTGAFAEECKEKLSSVTLSEESDEGLYAAECAMDALAAAAEAKEDILAFYTQLVAAQGLEEELAEELSAAYALAGSGAENCVKGGAMTLAKGALDLFAETSASCTAEELSAAITELETKEVDTMSAWVLSKECVWLLADAKAELARYAADGEGLAASFREVAAERGAALEEALGEAETLPAAREEAENALAGAAREIVTLVCQALAEELSTSAAQKLQTETEGLLSAVQSPETAFAAARSLSESYVSLILTEEEGEDVAIKSYRTLQLRAAAELVEGMTDADTLTAGIPALRSLVLSADAHIRGEKFLIAHRYSPAKAYADIAASDLEALTATAADYQALDAAAKEYLDGSYRGEYADFSIRLQDERNKAAFEGERDAAISELAAYLAGPGEGLVADARKAYREKLEGVAYVPLYEQTEGDYFHMREAELAGLLAEAKLSLAVEDLKEARLSALLAGYGDALENRSVLFSDKGKEELLATYNAAREDILRYTPDFRQSEEVMSRAESAFREIIERAASAYPKAEALAVSHGITAAGAGSYPEDLAEGELYGIISNEGGMSADTTFEMKLSEEAPNAATRKLAGGKAWRSTVEVTHFGGAAGGTYTVKILMTEEMKAYRDIAVFADGEALTTRVEGEFLLFETTHFSLFYLFGEREINLWWLIIVLTVILVAELIVILRLAYLLEHKHSTLAAMAPLAFILPDGAIVVCIVLGAAILVAAAVIAILCILLHRKPDSKIYVSSKKTTVEEERIVAEDPDSAPAEEKEPEQIGIFDLPIEETPLMEAAEPAEEPVEELMPEEEEVVEEPVEEPTGEEPVEEAPEEPVEEPEETEEPIVEPEPAFVPDSLPAEEIPFAEPEEEPAEEPIVEEPITEDAPVPEEEEVVEESVEEPTDEEPVEEAAEEVPVESIEEMPEETEEPIVEPEPIFVPDSLPAEEIPFAEPEEAPEEEPIIEETPAPEEREAEVPEEMPEESIEAASEEPVEEAAEEVPVEPIEEMPEETEEPIVEPEPVFVPDSLPAEAAPLEEPTEEPIEVPAEETSEQPEETSEEVTEEAQEAEKTSDEGAMSEVIPAPMPEEYRIPEEELRTEVTAAEVNALMQDTVAKTLIEQGDRVAKRGKTGIVNVDTLGEFFENGETVDLEELKKRVPYFPKKATYVKVLARGRLAKALVVVGDDFSLEAVKMIVLTGGHVIRTRREG